MRAYPAVSSDPAVLVRSYLDSFVSRDPEAIAAHVSEDFVNRHTSVLGEDCDGRIAYRERLQSFLDDLPGLAYTVERLLVDDDHVAAFYTLSADGNVTLRGVQHLVVRDGEIAERTDYFDSAGYLLQADPGALADLR